MHLCCSSKLLVPSPNIFNAPKEHLCNSKAPNAHKCTSNASNQPFCTSKAPNVHLCTSTSPNHLLCFYYAQRLSRPPPNNLTTKLYTGNLHEWALNLLKFNRSREMVAQASDIHNVVQTMLAV